MMFHLRGFIVLQVLFRFISFLVFAEWPRALWYHRVSHKNTGGLCLSCVLLTNAAWDLWDTFEIQCIWIYGVSLCRKYTKLIQFYPKPKLLMWRPKNAQKRKKLKLSFVTDIVLNQKIWLDLCLLFKIKLCISHHTKESFDILPANNGNVEVLNIVLSIHDHRESAKGKYMLTHTSQFLGHQHFRKLYWTNTIVCETLIDSTMDTVVFLEAETSECQVALFFWGFTMYVAIGNENLQLSSLHRQLLRSQNNAWGRGKCSFNSFTMKESSNCIAMPQHWGGGDLSYRCDIILIHCPDPSAEKKDVSYIFILVIFLCLPHNMWHY